MAKPIQIDIPTRNRSAELQQRLAEASVEHGDALLELLELIEELHERKVLTTVRGAIGARDSLISFAAQAAAQPESIRAIRNLLAIAKIVGKIDPELIEIVAKSIPPALQDRVARRTAPAPSLWKVARLFWSPPVRRTLMATGLVLAGIGYYLNQEKPGTAGKA